MSETGIAPTEADGETPVPSAWRPTLTAIVQALVERDYTLRRTIPGVSLQAPDIPLRIADYIEDYGETLTALPEDSWQSSIAAWEGEGRWTVLVNLFTQESGRSDMVLHVDVFQEASEHRYEVRLVYAP